MRADKILDSAQYVVDQQGHRTAVLLDLGAWEQLRLLLADLAEDEQLGRLMEAVAEDETLTGEAARLAYDEYRRNAN